MISLQLEEVINENMMKIDFSEATTDNVLLSVEKNVRIIYILKQIKETVEVFWALDFLLKI